MNGLSRREFIAAAASWAIASALPVWGEETRAKSSGSDMVLIPAGRFTVGDARAREVDLPAFLIDRYPVTNRDFHEFCESARYAPRPHWSGGVPSEAILDHPATFVSIVDALAYAEWAGKRLPTEAEWEKAARGTDGRPFPWGSTFDPEACQWNRACTPEGPGTTSVRAHPEGASPYGVMDMAGNAAEWCAVPSGSGVIKGGCWLTGEVTNLRIASRIVCGSATNAPMFCGFRCVKGVG